MPAAPGSGDRPPCTLESVRRAAPARGRACAATTMPAPHDSTPSVPPGTGTLPGDTGHGDAGGNGARGDNHRVGGNGHGTPPGGRLPAPERRPLPGPSTRPALVVFGII